MRWALALPRALGQALEQPLVRVRARAPAQALQVQALVQVQPQVQVPQQARVQRALAWLQARALPQEQAQRHGLGPAAQAAVRPSQAQQVAARWPGAAVRRQAWQASPQ